MPQNRRLHCANSERVRERETRTVMFSMGMFTSPLSSSAGLAPIGGMPACCPWPPKRDRPFDKFRIWSRFFRWAILNDSTRPSSDFLCWLITGRTSGTSGRAILSSTGISSSSVVSSGSPSHGFTPMQFCGCGCHSASPSLSTTTVWARLRFRDSSGLIQWLPSSFPCSRARRCCRCDTGDQRQQSDRRAAPS